MHGRVEVLSVRTDGRTVTTQQSASCDDEWGDLEDAATSGTQRWRQQWQWWRRQWWQRCCSVVWRRRGRGWSHATRRKLDMVTCDVGRELKMKQQQKKWFGILIFFKLKKYFFVIKFFLFYRKERGNNVFRKKVRYLGSQEVRFFYFQKGGQIIVASTVP